MKEIVYINRQTGQQVIEKVPGGGMLKFLYGSPIGKLTLWALVKRKLFSSLGGGYMNLKRSAKNIEPFIADHGIDIAQFLVPENGYKHFNDFFYRNIKPNARPIGEGIVSPADGKILVFENIKQSRQFFLKGIPFSLGSFLRNQELAKKYEGGSMAIIRLAPADYHRFHFPYQGEVGEVTRIKGAYYSVSPLALRKSLRIFVENKREYCELTHPDIGNCLIIDVGATLTGSIIQTFDPHSTVTKGQEKGYFAFGGSTTVLLFEPNRIEFSEDLIRNTKAGLETTVLMGETVGKAC
ncbi:MAG: phosphatidylserine decarboxylase [Bacteroidetes bacterium]|nr:phosphatidylserine decarboxylase [Bacteroidota bacterium]